MCGIFCYHSRTGKLDLAEQLKQLQQCSGRCRHRGPDNTRELVLPDDQTYFGFHRLAINGLDHGSDEPLHLKSESGREAWLICNGEIYDHEETEKKHDFAIKSRNDCEVILHLYFKFGFSKMLEMLDGVFSIVLYDVQTRELWIGNDPIGIRPLFMGRRGSDLAWASEPVSLVDCFR